MKRTPLYSYHSKYAKMTEFAGYEMPLWYTSTTEEHMSVRTNSGLFDVSHMGRFVLEGKGSTDFLESIVPTSVNPQPPGKAFYTLLLTDSAGIVDDLIIMKLGDERYMLVVNAANSETDMDHLKGRLSQSGPPIRDATKSTAMLAIQGPKAKEHLQSITDADLGQLKRFCCTETKVQGRQSLVSRTGYTGEDGFEVIIYDVTDEHREGALEIWDSLRAASLPCGLGARDSLRLEAGFPLHGVDMDQETNPFQADLAWVVSAGKTGYVGQRALSELSTEPPRTLRTGVVLTRGIPRHGFEVTDNSGSIGVVTSGTFSPILRKGIALCQIAYDGSAPGTKVKVVVRGSPNEGTTVKPPFYDQQLYGWKRQSNGK